MTPTAVPGKPGTPDITGTDKSSVALKWVAPDSDGGSPITNYLVQFRLSGSTQWLLANDSVTVPDTTFSVTGLKEGKEYEFRVMAKNKAGLSEPSITSPSIVTKARKGQTSDFLHQLLPLEQQSKFSLFSNTLLICVFVSVHVYICVIVC